MVSIGRLCQTGPLATPLRVDSFETPLYKLVHAVLIQQRRLNDAILKNMATQCADPNTTRVIERARREGLFSKAQR